MSQINLSQNFTLEEFTASKTATQRGLSNLPSAVHVVKMTHLCIFLLQPLREAIGKPIHISSGYRSSAVNFAVGGDANSQHMRGEAADIWVDGGETELRRVYELIIKRFIFDQIILERKGTSQWIHVSFRLGHNRRQVV